MRPLAERFWEKVEKGDGCWLWRAAKAPGGYGWMFMYERGKRRIVGAHRISYELVNGPIPPGLVIRHKCHVAACVRPDHLLVGTHADNAQDRRARYDAQTPRHALLRSEIPPQNRVERFWAHVRKTDGCWLWTSAETGHGYGNLTIKGLPHLAHRASYLLTYGLIPAGQCVLHRCDNRRCVRPDHLFLGTKADNARDCAAKGRANKPSGTDHYYRQQPELIPRGARHPRAKLKATDVRALRRAADAMKKAIARYRRLLNRIAEARGVRPNTLKDVTWRRQSWRHVA